MQQTKTRTYHVRGEPDPAVTEKAFSHATVYPKDAQLPQDFRLADFSKTTPYMSSCLRDGTPCDIYMLPYGSPGESAIIVRAYSAKSGPQATYDFSGGQFFQRG